MKKCDYCGKELQALNPPAEEYIEHIFCLHIFGFRLMLYKDSFDYGCPSCVAENQNDTRKEDMDAYAHDVITEEIRKGNLITNERY